MVLNDTRVYDKDTKEVRDCWIWCDRCKRFHAYRRFLGFICIRSIFGGGK